MKTQIINLNSAPSRESRRTDGFDTQEDRNPSLLAITIYDPVLGGDSNGDGEIDAKDMKIVGNIAKNVLTGYPDFAYTRGDEFINSTESKIETTTNTNSSPVAEIALPMPIGFSYEEGTNWADDNSATLGVGSFAAGKLANGMTSRGGTIGAILGIVGTGDFARGSKKIGQKKFGIGFEPRKEMFFNGPQFREFSFSWEFSPSSKKEADEIKNAVKIMRKHMYPDRISKAAASVGFEVWKLPSTFLLTFLTGDTENSYLPKIKPCVVSSISFNPTNSGNWKAFEDGSPVSMLLSITFKEVEVVTQTDVDKGY